VETQPFRSEKLYRTIFHDFPRALSGLDFLGGIVVKRPPVVGFCDKISPRRPSQFHRGFEKCEASNNEASNNEAEFSRNRRPGCGAALVFKVDEALVELKIVSSIKAQYS